jgi:tetratricopeptide (TPR) repeat protein
VVELFANRYAVERVLGQGGMGRVYLAHDRLMGGRAVALKEIRVDVLSRKVLAALAHEFSVLCRLHHPNLVEVYDFCLAPHCYFTMEYVDGCDLRTADLDEDGLYDAIAQVCRALGYVHARGLVHLDVKPSNILYSKGNVKLMDFGVASYEKGEPVAGYTVGFVAPEVIEGHQFDGRADLFALGRTLLKLREDCDPSLAATERRDERTIDHPRSIITTKEAQGVPSRLLPVIERLVRVDPNERYATAAEVIEALSEACGRHFPVETAATHSGSVQSPRLLARNPELATLMNAWKLAQNGSPQHVVVRGGAGLGKTRLSRELRAQAQLDGGLVLEVSGGREESESWGAAAALVEQLAALRVSLDPATRGELARLNPSLFPDAPPTAPLDSAASKSRLIEAVLTMLEAAAREWSILLVIDDAHWLDEASRQLFDALARRKQRGLLLLALARESGGGLLAGDSVELQPIGRASAQALADEVFGSGVIPAPFIDRAVESARGSTFYLCELLNLLVDENVVSRRGTGWQWSRDPERLPITPADVVSARIRLLPQSLRRLLACASLLGAQFDPAIVEEVIGRSHAAFNDLIGRRLLGGEGRSLRFTSDEVHGAAMVDALAAPDWLVLHRQLAQAAAHHGAHPAEIARLFLGSDLPVAGIAFEVEAARRAVHLFDHAGAVRHTGRALRLLKKHEPPARAKLEWELHALTLEAIRAGGLGQIATDEEAALAAARAVGEEADAHLRLARVALQRGRFADVKEKANNALELSGRTRTHLEALRLAGLARYNLGELESAIAHLDEAVDLGHSLGDARAEAAALDDRGLVHGYSGDFEAAVADHSAALALLENGPSDARATAHNNLGFAYWGLGRYQHAMADLSAALTLRRSFNDLWGEGVTRNNLGNVLRHLGDLEGAQVACEEAYALCRRSGNRLYEAIALNNLGQIEEERTRLDRAAAFYHEALALARTLGDRIREGDNLANLGVCALHAGRRDEARDWLAESVALRREIGDRAYLVLDLSYLARTEIESDPTAARLHLDEALRLMQSGIEQVQAVHLNAHLVLAALGESERASAELQQATRVIEERLADLRADARWKFVANLRVNREIMRLADLSR